jgi:hypothetical protein
LERDHAPLGFFPASIAWNSQTWLTFQADDYSEEYSSRTGKTRAVRAMLAAISRREKDGANIIYTADGPTLENDELYVEFLTGAHDAFVIDDADHPFPFVEV